MKYITTLALILVLSTAQATKPMPPPGDEVTQVSKQKQIAKQNNDQKQIAKQNNNQKQITKQDTKQISKQATAVDTKVKTNVANESNQNIGPMSSNLDAGDYNYDYNYEEAAASAIAIASSVCQDASAAQAVKFGISKTSQSEFCKYMTLATMKFTAADLLACKKSEFVSKGGEIANPNPTTCQRNQWKLFHEGNGYINKAATILEEHEDGFLKQFWNKVIW